MPISAGRLVAVAALTLTCAGALYYASRHSHTIPTADPFIDSKACAACHAAIAKSYAATGMGRSLSLPTRTNISPGTYYHAASDRAYEVLERNGEFFQRRHQKGYEGKDDQILERRIEYVIGSGNHARSYLFRSADGRLTEMPVSWYASDGGHLAMSPGYDRAAHDDFRRTVAPNCIFCHDAYPKNASLDAPIPEGIDCQRCHGPGRAHAEAAGSGKASKDDVRKLIVNPARLDRTRQLEVCMQCHLEPTSRPLPNLIVKYGHGPFDYRAGQPLGDYFLFFDHAPNAGEDDKFEVAHQAYRLRKSKCFQASAMTCSTCHNAHDIPRGETAVAHYTAACRQCHAAAHANGAPGKGTCMDCHMPTRRTDDAPHVAMTDHFIQRAKPPARTASARDSAPYRGEVVPYYGKPDDLYLAVAQVQDGSNLAAGIPHLRGAIEAQKPAVPDFDYELAKAYSKAGNSKEAVHWAEEALRKRPDYTAARKELGLALTATGDLSRAAEAFAAIPPDSATRGNLGNVYLRQGRIDDAVRVLSEAPESPEASNSLGMALTQKGDASGAERAFRNAINLQPDFAEAHYNLANLLASTRDYRQAAYHFEKAIAAKPDYAEAHHRYGVLHLVMNAPDAAQREFELALRQKPALAEAHTDLASVLEAKGQLARAAAEYSAAIATDPNAYDAHLALGIMLARSGRMSEARPHFEAASRSTDPEIRSTALKALN